MGQKIETLKIPEYAINPLFNTLNFNWLFVLLRKIIPTNNVNVYAIYNSNYKKVRKDSGKFAAYLDLQRLIEFCNKLKGVLFVADYEEYQFFVISEADITEALLNEFNEDKTINIRIGGTASRKNDNAFTIIDRCLKASSLAHKSEDGCLLI